MNNWLFFYLYILYQLQTWNCSDNQNKNNSMFTIGTKHVDHQRICCLYPKFENQFFVNLHVLYKLQTWNCCASFSNQIKSKQKQFYASDLYKIQKFTKNQTSKFGIDLSCILLKGRHSQNDFFKPTFPPNNERTNSTLLLWNLRLTCFCSFLEEIEDTKKTFWN